MKPGDWKCTNPICNFTNFGTRDKCFKCGIDKVKLQISEEPTTCCVCMDKPVTFGVFHQGTVHFCLCDVCGFALNKCPICRTFSSSN